MPPVIEANGSPESERGTSQFLPLISRLGQAAPAKAPARKDARRPDPGAPPRKRRWGPVRRAIIVFGVALFAGVLTLLISEHITPTYSSSSELRIVVGGVDGLGQDSLLASNDLAAQLVQLISTNKVLTAPALTLRIPVSKLRTEISAGTVAQQNLLQITAQASSAAESERVAKVVSQSFLAFMKADAANTVAAAAAGLTKSIAGLGRLQNRLSAELVTARGTGQKAVLLTQISATLTERQTLSSQLAQRQAVGSPIVETVQSAGVGSEVAPRPKVYALIGALVAGFVALQLLALANRRRPSPRS